MRSSFFFQAEDGIRDLVRSRGLGDVYKRQGQDRPPAQSRPQSHTALDRRSLDIIPVSYTHLTLPTILRVSINEVVVFFSSRRRHTRSSTVSWARRCV